jgi:hypothetical protein
MRFAKDALRTAPQFPLPAQAQTGCFLAGCPVVFAMKIESRSDAGQIVEHVNAVIPHGSLPKFLSLENAWNVIECGGNHGGLGASWGSQAPQA